jgi:hypothetical protein
VERTPLHIIAQSALSSAKMVKMNFKKNRIAAGVSFNGLSRQARAKHFSG